MKYVFYEHPAWALKLLGFLCVSLSVPGQAVHKRQRSTAVNRARLGSGGGDTKPWKQSLGLPRFKSYKKAQLLVNSPVVWKCQVCV